MIFHFLLKHGIRPVDAWHLTAEIRHLFFSGF